MRATTVSEAYITSICETDRRGHCHCRPACIIVNTSVAGAARPPGVGAAASRRCVDARALSGRPSSHRRQTANGMLVRQDTLRPAPARSHRTPLTREFGLPLYQQIHHLLRHRITTGE